MSSKQLKKQKPDFRAYLTMYFDKDIGALKNYMFTSSFISYIAAAVFLALSFVFNGDYVYIERFSEDIFIGSLGVIWKTILIDGFFFFTLISYGNVREIMGGSVSIKELVVIIIISLVQGYKDGIVILTSIYGIIMIITFMKKRQQKMQARINEEQNIEDYLNRKKKK